MPIRTDSSVLYFTELFIFWEKQLLFGVWCLELPDVSVSASQSTLENCQHPITETQSWALRMCSKEWGLLTVDSHILLQVAALLPHSLLTYSHCKGPFQACGSGIGQHSDELLWLYSNLYLGIKQVRPLKQIKSDSLIPKWLIFENTELSHSSWYLIESCLCKLHADFCGDSSTQQSCVLAEQKAAGGSSSHLSQNETSGRRSVSLGGAFWKPSGSSPSRAVISQMLSSAGQSKWRRSWAEVGLAVSLVDWENHLQLM